MKLLNRPRERHVADAVIADPAENTVIDPSGAVRSTQAADVSMPREQLDAMWTPMHLERLARTYWKYLSRVTLGLIRVHYSDDERAVVLLRRPLVLLRFHSPEYEMSERRGLVRWRIRDGLLVSRRDEGYLEIDVRRIADADPRRGSIHVEVEVASFYPAIAQWLTSFVYRNTQSRIHVLVTHGFLRSLARRELEESVVGRFAAPAPATNGGPLPAGRVPEDTYVGDTPWAVVVALVAVLAAGLAAAVRRLRD